MCTHNYKPTFALPCMLNISPLLQVLCTNIFPYLASCLVILLMVSFAVQKLFSLIGPHLLIFNFYFPCLWGLFHQKETNKQTKKQQNTSETMVRKFSACILLCILLFQVLYSSVYSTPCYFLYMALNSNLLSFFCM